MEKRFATGHSAVAPQDGLAVLVVTRRWLAGVPR
jgi:hypothetical protein